jgi:hypothetical protein
MKLTRWSLVFASTLLLHKNTAHKFDNKLASLHNAIEDEIESHMALEAPTFRAEDTKVVSDTSCKVYIFVP